MIDCLQAEEGEYRHRNRAICIGQGPWEVGFSLQQTDPLPRLASICMGICRIERHGEKFTVEPTANKLGLFVRNGKGESAIIKAREDSSGIYLVQCRGKESWQGSVDGAVTQAISFILGEGESPKSLEDAGR